jgi:hypothetical protein
MDNRLSETVEKLKSEKRVIAKKVLELSNSFKHTIARIEKTYEEKFALYESRLEELENERSKKCVETDAKVVTLGHKLGKIEKENLEKCTNYESKVDGAIFDFECLKKE